MWLVVTLYFGIGVALVVDSIDEEFPDRNVNKTDLLIAVVSLLLFWPILLPIFLYVRWTK